MATNIAPHNLGEVIEATLHCIDYPSASIEELNNFVLLASTKVQKPNPPSVNSFKNPKPIYPR